jgi:uncharacterized protein DUF2125
MRRATIVVLIGILVVGFGAYSAYWWVAAGRIKLAAGDWAQAAHQKQLDVSWQSIRVGGYPFSFRLQLGDAVLTDKAANPPVELRASQISASIWPWDFHDLWLDAPNGFRALAGADTAPLAKLEAAAADGAIAIAGDGGATLWLDLYQPKIDATETVSARVASAWVIVPAHPPASHSDPGIAAALLLHDLTLPAAPQGFSQTVDELGFGVTMMGALPAGPLKEAVAAWRDGGGTLELDHLDLRWGAIGLTGSGTLALDADLQPVGGFSGAISGYDQLLNALVAAGRVKASDARVARLALSMLGSVGPDGRPQISTSFAIQNGEMQLGPAKLGKAPHIDW